MEEGIQEVGGPLVAFSDLWALTCGLGLQEWSENPKRHSGPTHCSPTAAEWWLPPGHQGWAEDVALPEKPLT